MVLSCANATPAKNNPATMKLIAGGLSFICNAIRRSVLFIGYQQRTVIESQDVTRAAIEHVRLFIEKSHHERFNPGFAAVDSGDDDVKTEFLFPIPRAMPCDESNVAIVLGEHRTGIKLDAKCRRMWAQ